MMVVNKIQSNENTILIKKTHNSSFFVKLSILQNIIIESLNKIKIVDQISNIKVWTSHDFYLNIQIFITFMKPLNNIFYQIQAIKRNIAKAIFAYLAIKISNLSVVY